MDTLPARNQCMVKVTPRLLACTNNDVVDSEDLGSATRIDNVKPLIIDPRIGHTRQQVNPLLQQSLAMDPSGAFPRTHDLSMLPLQKEYLSRAWSGIGRHQTTPR